MSYRFSYCCCRSIIFSFNFSIDSFGVCVCEFVTCGCVFCVSYLVCDILKTWWRTYDPHNDGQLNVSRRLSRRLNKAMSHCPVVCPSHGQRRDSGPWRIDLQVSRHPVAFYTNPQYIRIVGCKSITIGKGIKPRCRSLSADETCPNSLNPQPNIDIIALLI